MPTTTSFFTSRYTSEHKVFHPTRPTQLPDDSPLLAEHLQQAGYHTLCLSTANRLTPAYGCNRGFDRFIYHWPEKGHTALDYDASRWLSEVIGHLDGHADDRTFSYVHFPDTHQVWNVNPLNRSFNLERRGDSSGLDLEQLREAENAAEQGDQLNKIRLYELDRMLGWLYGYLEQRFGDDFMVMITADHGSPWKHLREQRPKNEPTLVSDRITTFMMMQGARVPDLRYGGLVNTTLDMMPTILAGAGLPIPDGLSGQNMLAGDYVHDAIISESIYAGVYEIHVTDGQRSWIEQYTIDDEAMQLGEEPLFSGLFHAATRTYCEQESGSADDLRHLARQHIESMALRK
jgi:arylsulfatase A-like enzyme